MYFLSLTKKIFTTVAILLGAACFTRVCAQGSVSAAPYPIEVLQPDASKIMVVGKGNIVTNYAETTDGYTIVKNRAGIYEYAVQSASGNLSASGVKAKNPGERSRAEHVSLQAVPKHARESAAARLQRQPADPFYQYQTSQGPDEAFPSTGTRKALMILIKYPDLGNTNTVGEFQNFMNQPNYNSTGSFKDYYLANSFNQLNVTTDVFGWYTAANNYDYYGRQNGYEPSQELVGEAVDAAESAGVNFSQYDNDNDGYVDGVIVVHAGPGAEEGSQMQYIWSHRWVLSNPRTYDGKTIYDYMMNPERRSSGMVGIGVFCHEFGHGLGLPDLYDTDPDNGDSEGIGNWCLMAGGAWLGGEHTPANMSAWCKMKLGWQIPTIISATGGYSLTPANNNNVSYKINTPVANEYFLLENRQKTGWDTYLPGEGLAIWHINTNATGNADEDLKLVDLEEADGLNDLDNGNGRGDAGDLFPGFTSKISFNNTTNPNSNNYNGNSSGVFISQISETLGSVDNVSFFLGTPTNYLAQFLSLSSGSPVWCLGETRTVSVTVKNIGSQAWIGGGLTFNLAYWWNGQTRSTNPRIPILTNMAPGETRAFNVNITAPISPGSNNLTFDVVKETDCWFADNTGSCGPGNSVYVSPITIDEPTIVAPIQGADTVSAGQTITLSSAQPTGGIITTSGNYRIHTFNSNGDFVMPDGLTTTATVFLIGGGGGGGYGRGGGGGAGGYIYSNYWLTSGSNIGIAVGAGGVGATSNTIKGGNGESSSFGAQVAYGGGGGGTHNISGSYSNGLNGGSGGGAAMNFNTYTFTGGAPVSGQGNQAGGSGQQGTDNPRNTGGGGGAGGVGITGVGTSIRPDGGVGISTDIDGTLKYYGGGGGGGDGRDSNNPAYTSAGRGIGGNGGGGDGADVNGTPTAGLPNTGGGGGGGNNAVSANGANGGSGVVIVRYPMGVWWSDNPSVATVDANGIVTGITAGSAIINYTITNDNGCVYSAQKNITVKNCSPSATLTDCNGIISDGSLLDNYANSTSCEWLIQPVGASSVSLSFTEFATESNDYVYVYDGATTASPLLGTFSGIGLPAALVSSGGSMLVVFISNASGAEQGWTASYSCQTPSFCSGISTLTDCSGSFSDGSGASNYLDNSSCSWLLQPAGATSITLNFTEFETESGYDYVNVYDGPTSGYALLAQLNGTTLPASITSSGGSMFVEFFTDGSITYQGWSATYSCQNGGGNCPVNTSIFTYFGTYNGNEYYYSNNTDTWENAEANCIANCGHQVCIGSAAEQTFVESILPANEKWIGANDIASEGNFAWVSGEPFSYTNWGAGEPNGGSWENLVMMWGSGNLYGIPVGLWNDGSNGVPNYYILERPEQPADATISGSIRTESGNPVPGVTVILSEGATDTVVTGNDGLYSFSVPTGGNYTITPSKSNDVPTNTGITTSDITRIRRHVLGSAYLDSPYKTIAADASNSSNSTPVTTGDIPPVRRVVLNNTAKFPPSNSRLWEFVSSSHVFAAPAPGEPYSPFPFTKTRSYTDLSDSQSNQDFIGVKVGDVSGNWAAPKMGTVGEVQFAMENYQTLSGEEITIPVRVKDFNDIAGYQFTMTWNPEVIQLLEVASQSIPAYYGEQSISEGMLTTSWNDGAGGAITLNDDAIAFELKFKVTGALGTSTEIKIGSEITVSEAYTDALDLLDITATNGSVKVGDVISSLNTQHSTLNTLQVQPNPFSNVTNIIFTLPQEEHVHIVIYDLLGKEMKMFNGNYAAGKHSLEWNGTDNEGLPLSKGMYHVRMTAGENTKSLKALLLR